MEIIAITVICTVVFGAVAAIAAFIHQLAMSRDKSLNDQAQQRALDKEAKELGKLRRKMEKTERFSPQRELIDQNRKDIADLDEKIEKTLGKKSVLIHEFAEWSLNESSRLIKYNPEDEICLSLSQVEAKTRRDLTLYDEEINRLQQRREKLCSNNEMISSRLLDNLQDYNHNLDSLYQHHSELIEKVNLRYIQSTEGTTRRMQHSSSLLYRTIFTKPFDFFTNLFSRSSNISLNRIVDEIKNRKAVDTAQQAINNPLDIDDINEDNLADSPIAAC